MCWRGESRSTICWSVKVSALMDFLLSLFWNPPPPPPPCSLTTLTPAAQPPISPWTAHRLPRTYSSFKFIKSLWQIEPRWTTVAEIRLRFGAAAVRLDDLSLLLFIYDAGAGWWLFIWPLCRPLFEDDLKGTDGLFLSVFALIAPLEWIQLIGNISAACLLRQDQLSSTRWVFASRAVAPFPPFWRNAATRMTRKLASGGEEWIEVAIWWHSRSFTSSEPRWLKAFKWAWSRSYTGTGGTSGQYFVSCQITVRAPAAIYAKLFVWITLMFSVSGICRCSPRTSLGFFFFLTAASKSELCEHSPQEKVMGVRRR